MSKDLKSKEFYRKKRIKKKKCNLNILIDRKE
jgi:hypothetical protein